ERGLAAEGHAQTDRRRHRQCHVGQPLPLRYLPTHPRRHPDGRRDEGSLTMKTAHNASRRQFIQTSAVVGSGLFTGGLLVGCAMMPDKGPMAAALRPSATAEGAMPNAWVKVGTDNTVSIICARAEM